MAANPTTDSVSIGGASPDPWLPDTYLGFADARQRPALDLIARIPLTDPRVIVDLGCGPGTVTGRLAARWPEATITGIDSSPAMLERARAEAPERGWLETDIARWTPAEPADLIFSNAALHWLDDHDILFPRLMKAARPGGCLAVQMPGNFDAPSHLEAFALAQDGRWQERLGPLVRSNPVAPPESYMRWLTPLAASVDIWETVYYHRLRGRDPVVEWARSTALAPLFAPLDAAGRHAFLAEYAERMASAYPPETDGVTVFPFRRLFIVARA